MTSRAETFARTILILATVVGIMHHVDHVLRVDHSGWPFIAKVTPLTYSFIAYPILLFAIFSRRSPNWVRLALVAALTAFTLFSHVTVETPYMQYAMWAFNRSIDPAAGGVENYFCIQSPALGLIAAGISMTLNTLLVAATAAMLVASWPKAADAEPVS